MDYLGHLRGVGQAPYADDLAGRFDLELGRARDLCTCRSGSPPSTFDEEVVRMTRSVVGRVALVTGLVLLLAACAAGVNDVVDGPGARGAGFWLGLWHGAISPVTFLISLFRDDVNIYEVHNNGNWYDFGFIIGVSAAFSGAARSASAAGPRRSSDRNRPAVGS